MITVRRSEERRHVQSRSQNTWMTFDLDSDVDPLRGGFHGLESLNEEHAAPKMCLHPQTREDIDLLIYVREGSITLHGEAGPLGRMGAGEFQRRNMSSGTSYQAVNASPTEIAHVFQSGLKLGPVASTAILEQRRFYTAQRTGTLRLVASRGGMGDSLSLTQDARVYSSILLQGNHLVHELDRGRSAWLHVVKGRIRLQDHSLRTGDGAALVDEAAASFTAQEPSEILLFDLC